MTNNKILPFNPLDKKNLGESVGMAMLNQPVLPLSTVPRFYGAGIYAIYYIGNFNAYKAITDNNLDQKFSSPIYVGKAEPEGKRKGNVSEINNETSLHKRLKEHAKSISDTDNLELNDFYCRYLIVDDIWIPLGESLLIARFSPLWNKLIDGFGNHNPGKGRHAGMCSRWDSLHPGRPWVKNFSPRIETPDIIAREAEEYLRANSP